MLISIISTVLYFTHKEPEQKEEVINYLQENKKELVEIKIEKIEKKEIDLFPQDSIEVYKVIIDNEEAKKANLHQMEDIYQTTLLIHSNEAKNLFDNQKSFFVSKEKLPFINNHGLTNIVYYFCNNLYELSCFAGKGNVGMIKKNKNKIQIYSEF